MYEETAQTDIRVQEAEKAHSIRFFSQGRGAKKKDPNCIQIRVLLCERARKRTEIKVRRYKRNICRLAKLELAKSLYSFQEKVF